MTRKLWNLITHVERVQTGCWECSTRTEDGHRISGFGISRKQSIYDAHQKAKVYGDYLYPDCRA